jgi:hypothetical protein
MYMLRHYMDRYKSKLIVQVGYHVYRTNFPDDFLEIRRLCDELGFIFAPVIATLMPVEKAVKAVEGALDAADQPVVEKMVLSLKEWSENLAPYRDNYRDCQYRSIRTTINYDGSVALCCATYEQDKIIARNFLDVGHDELQRRKYAHSFCATCMCHNLDMMYTAVPSPKMEAAAAEILGPIWQAFMEESYLDATPKICWNDQRLEIQEAADLAAALQRAGEASDARLIYELICNEMPNHAEAHFQLGWLVAGEDLKRTLDLLARKLQPGHDAYERAEQELLASRRLIRVGEEIVEMRTPAAG